MLFGCLCLPPRPGDTRSIFVLQFHVLTVCSFIGRLAAGLKRNMQGRVGGGQVLPPRGAAFRLLRGNHGGLTTQQAWQVFAR
jgi:hypothetical protein